MRRTAIRLVCCGAVWMAAELSAMNVGPFGPNGQGGSKNGQTFQIGAGGSVHELDAFLAVDGWDLNGSLVGTSAPLSSHSPPPGLTYGFSSALSNGTDLVLTYDFLNQSSGGFTNLRFAVLLDVEIDQETNTFFNEYGRVVGTPGEDASDADPDLWQIDEPGFAGGTLFSNLFQGSLNNSNSIPQSAPNDVALALGFYLGTLQPGESNRVRILISEAGNKLGNFALEQLDTDPHSATLITLSGQAQTNGVSSIFGDSAGLANLSFTWRLKPSTGSLIGTLTITNLPASGKVLSAPFQLGFPTSTNFWLAHPTGTLGNGLPYLDLTAGVTAGAGGGTLSPGQKVVVDGIEVFSRNRSAPPTGMFQLWTTQQ